MVELVWDNKKEMLEEVNSEDFLKTDKHFEYNKEESKNFDTTENLYIEGDNLEALKLLQKDYNNKIKMIYIDPPYNTEKKFVYNDTFRNKRKKECRHSGWLNMMYPRLILAKNLLKEDGVIFISIDEYEFGNLKKMCDEIYGENNFVSDFVWKKKQGGGNDSNNVVVEHEYIICYAKNINNIRLNLDKKYKLSDSLYPNKDEQGDYGLITLDKSSIQFSQSLVFEIKGTDGKVYLPRVIKGKQSCWRWSKKKVENEYNNLVFKNDKVYTKYYRPEGVTPKSLLIDSIYGRTESGNDDIKALFEKNPFSYPKPVVLINHFLSIASDNSDIILDFFSGSATTAHAVMQLNAEDNGKRKFIMVQLPEECKNKNLGYDNICEIGKERIKRAGDKIKEENKDKDGIEDLDIGFKVIKIK